jgi:hypothetical protein
MQTEFDVLACRMLHADCASMDVRIYCSLQIPRTMSRRRDRRSAKSTWAWHRPSRTRVQRRTFGDFSLSRSAVER